MSMVHRRSIEHHRIDEEETIYKKYELGRALGKGSFGIVYEIKNKETDEKFAIKIINKDKAGKDKVIFQNEVSIMKSVQHPNLIKLEEVYESKKKLYLITELCEAGELAKWIKEHGPIEEHKSRIIMKKIVEAIIYLHKIDIVHRDLKLENILVKEHTNDIEKLDIKITDFGLSSQREIVGTDSMFEEYCGTPLYMGIFWILIFVGLSLFKISLLIAPEIIDNLPYSQLCDVWALGIIMYMILTSHVPFTAETDSKLREQIRKAEINTSSERYKRLSAEAKDCLQKMFKINPAHRITSSELLSHPWFLNKRLTDLPENKNVLELMSEMLREQEQSAIQSQEMHHNDHDRHSPEQHNNNHHHLDHNNAHRQSQNNNNNNNNNNRSNGNTSNRRSTENGSRLGAITTQKAHAPSTSTHHTNSNNNNILNSHYPNSTTTHTNHANHHNHHNYNNPSSHHNGNHHNNNNNNNNNNNSNHHGNNATKTNSNNRQQLDSNFSPIITNRQYNNNNNTHSTPTATANIINKINISSNNNRYKNIPFLNNSPNKKRTNTFIIGTNNNKYKSNANSNSNINNNNNNNSSSLFVQEEITLLNNNNNNNNNNQNYNKSTSPSYPSKNTELFKKYLNVNIDTKRSPSNDSKHSNESINTNNNNNAKRMFQPKPQSQPQSQQLQPAHTSRLLSGSSTTSNYTQMTVNRQQQQQNQYNSNTFLPKIGTPLSNISRNSNSSSTLKLNRLIKQQH